MKVEKWMAKAVRMKEEGMPCREIAERLGKKHSTVQEFLKRYNRLVPEAREAYLSGKIGSRVTMTLAALTEEQQKEVLKIINGEGKESSSELRKEIEELRAEKKMLEREVRRLRAPSLFASKLRKLTLALEKEEAEVAELTSQVDLKDYYLEAQRWIGVFQRYERYVRDALDGRKVIVLDIEASKR